MLTWIKETFAKIVTVVITVGVFIYFLFKSKDVGETEDEKTFVKAQATTEAKEASADAQATSSVAAYQQLKSEFLRNSGNSPAGGDEP